MKKLENQREIIFRTAKEIILSENIDKFSIRMLSKRCNVSLGTIYNYYGNKNDILIDITKDLWMNYIDYIKNNVNHKYSFLERIEFYYLSLVGFSDKFNYKILSKELSSSFRKVGKAYHNAFFDIWKEIVKEDASRILKLDHDKSTIIADFICNNLISLISSNTYEYKTFNSILKMLLEKI